MLTTTTSARPETCLAAFFHGPGRPLELRNVPVPATEAGCALVRVECCTICGSDVHTITGARNEPVPSILGHEAMGVVIEVGEPALADIDGRPLAPGDRITWSPVVSCGSCDRCRGGIPQKCRSVFKYGHALASGPGLLSGGFAELILLRPGTTAIRLGADDPIEVFSPVSCATATIAAALRAAGPVSARRALVLGAGMLGLTAAAFLKSRDASLVAVSDVNARRLARASQFGADCSIEWQADIAAYRQELNRTAGTDRFDVVLDVSGSPEAVEAACRLGEVGATVVLAGSVLPSRAAAIDPEFVVRNLLTIRGVHNYAPEDLRTAVEFLRQSRLRFPFASLVERVFPLAEVNDAFEMAMRDRPVRVGVCPGQSM